MKNLTRKQVTEAAQIIDTLEQAREMRGALGKQKLAIMTTDGDSQIDVDGDLAVGIIDSIISDCEHRLRKLEI